MRSADLGEALGELEIGGRRVDRIGVEHDQHLDLTGIHRRDQRTERLDLIDRSGRDRLAVERRSRRRCRAPR